MDMSGGVPRGMIRVMANEPEFLRSLAQNDYMIDQHFLDDGKRLNEIADEWARLKESEEQACWMMDLMANDTDNMSEELHRIKESLRARMERSGD